MNMKSPRLNDKLNGIALATIVAIVLSVICAGVNVVIESGQMSSAHGEATAKAVASAAVVAAVR